MWRTRARRPKPVRSCGSGQGARRSKDAGARARRGRIDGCEHARRRRGDRARRYRERKNGQRDAQTATAVGAVVGTVVLARVAALVLGVCVAVVAAGVRAGVLLVITGVGIADLVVAGTGNATGSRRGRKRDRATEPSGAKEHAHHQQPQGRHSQGAGDVARVEHQGIVILRVAASARVETIVAGSYHR